MLILAEWNILSRLSTWNPCLKGMKGLSVYDNFFFQIRSRIKVCHRCTRRLLSRMLIDNKEHHLFQLRCLLNGTNIYLGRTWPSAQVSKWSIFFVIDVPIKFQGSQFDPISSKVTVIHIHWLLWLMPFLHRRHGDSNTLAAEQQLMCYVTGQSCGVTDHRALRTQQTIADPDWIRCKRAYKRTWCCFNFSRWRCSNLLRASTESCLFVNVLNLDLCLWNFMHYIHVRPIFIGQNILYMFAKPCRSNRRL